MKVMIVEIPTFDSLMENIEGLVGKAKKAAARKVNSTKPSCYGSPNRFNNNPIEDRWIGAAREPWAVGGEEADENLRFGAAFEIDEPRCEDYDCRFEFEDDHAAFDRFVEASEDCVARGLDKKSNAPIHKCNAVRRRLQDGPPIGINLIGETQWWCEPCGW